MKRRFLSILLTVCMLVYMFPAGGIWAAGSYDDEFSPRYIKNTEDTERIIGISTPSNAATPSDAATSSNASKAPSTAVERVQSLIDALPSLEDVQAMDIDGQRAAYDQTQEAYDAYMELTEDQRALIKGAEIFEVLFE